MTYTDTLESFADQVAAQVAAAWTAWQAGQLTTAEFVLVVVAYLVAADRQAAGLSDAALAAYLTVSYQQPVPALGAGAPDLDHEPRVRELIEQDAPVEQWRDYGRGSALASAQMAYGDDMQRRGIPGWTRVLDAGACKLCRDLAGVVLPASAPMYHHDGCGCTQKPVLTTEGK